MKVGSFVKYIPGGFIGELCKKLSTKKVYTVRAIYSGVGLKSRPGGTLIVLLEEVVNEMSYTGREMGYCIDSLREIEFPPSLADEIEECLTRELINQ